MRCYENTRQISCDFYLVPNCIFLVLHTYYSRSKCKKSTALDDGVVIFFPHMYDLESIAVRWWCQKIPRPAYWLAPVWIWNSYVYSYVVERISVYSLRWLSGCVNGYGMKVFSLIPLCNIFKGNQRIIRFAVDRSVNKIGFGYPRYAEALVSTK